MNAALRSRPADLRCESFAVWLDRQIAAAKALHDSTTTPGRKRRHWDALLLLQGIKAEFERRVAR